MIYDAQGGTLLNARFNKYINSEGMAH